MPINAEVVCVPPTLGVSCCQGDINKAGCALSSALKHLLSPVDCLLRPLHVLPGKRWRTLRRTLQSLTHIFQSPSDYWHCFSLSLWHLQVKQIYLSLLNWLNTFISHSNWLPLQFISDSRLSWVEEADLTPAKSTWCPVLCFFSFSRFVRQPMGKLTDELMLATGLL